MKLPLYLLVFGLLTACQEAKESPTPENLPKEKSAVPEMTMSYEKGTFGYDLNFMSKFQKDLIVLKSVDEKAQVLVSPALQGRVMTSSAEGETGTSFGWINYDLFEKGFQKDAHIHPFGGEERFWIGPEGGQFAVFFKKGVPFTFENWFTPPAIDIEPFEVVSTSSDKAIFKRQMQLTNYSGTILDMRIDREIRLSEASEVERVLGISLAKEMRMVAYQTRNTITNLGTNEWTTTSGMPSIWLLGMLNSSPTTTVAIPIKKGDEKTLGIYVNDDYFGKVSADRLRTEEGIVYFKADGQKRGKIGISPKRALPFAGSYDPQTGVLTLIRCDIPPNASNYVNSAWKYQEKPFGGDVINAYNDGKLEDGTQLGPFYELESSSPALNLKPNAAATFSQYTFHFKGTPAQLDPISLKALGVKTDAIRMK